MTAPYRDGRGGGPSDRYPVPHSTNVCRSFRESSGWRARLRA